MTDLRNYSHEFITEFIELYRNNPCLWKIKSKEYSNRNKKSAAYEVLCEKLKEKEMKKVKQSETSGTAEDDVYKPNLWYFDQLLFLMDQETPRLSFSNMEDDSDDNETISNENDTQDNHTHEVEENVATPDTPISQLLSRSTSTRSYNKRSRVDRSDEILNLVAKKLKSSDCQLYTSYGNHIAEELRTLPKDQALFYQKIINDAIFEAKLGNLDRTSKVVKKNIIEQMVPRVSRQVLLQPAY